MEDTRILGCVRTHTPQNTDNSTVAPNEPFLATLFLRVFVINNVESPASPCFDLAESYHVSGVIYERIR